MDAQNDATSLAAMGQNDETAFDALFRTYYEPLCRYASTLLDCDMDDAEDIVQQVFIKFWEQRSALEVRWSAKAYLYKMVHNRCLNRRRAAVTREKYTLFNAQQLEQGHNPVEGNAAELGERLQKALAKLPKECRRIFELSRFEELKYREIAEQLQISIKTVETQMGKALRIMRSELADYLLTGYGLLVYWLMG